MYSIQLNEKGAQKYGCPGPGRYFLTDENAGQCMAMHWGKHALPLSMPPVPRNDVATNLLVIRVGGFGDLLFLSAVLAEYHERHPLVKLHVACMPVYQQVFAHLPYITTIAYPVSAEDMAQMGVAISMEDAVEDNQIAHPTESMARRMGMEPLNNPLPRYQVTEEEQQAAWERFGLPHTGKRLGVQVRASVLSRCWPKTLLAQFCRLALSDNWQIMFFGAPGDAPDPPDWEKMSAEARKRMVNLTTLQPSLSFRESAAALATCHAVVAPDSAICHLAGTLGIPTVALYGPFHWRQRTGIFPSVHALQGDARCAPCHHHEKGGQVWPDDGPCNETRHCLAMGNIEPARVMAKLTKLYEAELAKAKGQLLTASGGCASQPE